MDPDRYLRYAFDALGEILSTPATYKGPVIWRNAWIPQDALCLEISFYLARALNIPGCYA